MADLHDQLTEIRGVGDATAKEILGTIDTDSGDTSQARDLLQEALEHFDASGGMDPTAQQGRDRVEKALAMLEVSSDE
ncbi:hypothetical protein HALLA_12020 [Halostagnicola larsenii XH-48]|uniref:Uncharacterized protein n=1 Tax=Halostagnicola larsenii XH-48 TaxID=797299 RepID=W0JQN1_9EURY|nr:hypothetical protein [Halostagnicola larsenii]AHG00904.1 hypothetical protein HALLA_11730 [Halostagnicola larsenii XH-48]AHG00951.1 hypothetical protein HALLA_12020 [Halostagnicola larsenii XH-48]